MPSRLLIAVWVSSMASMGFAAEPRWVLGQADPSIVLHTQTVVGMTQDGKFVAYPSGHFEISILETATGKVVRKLPVKNVDLRDPLRFTPDGSGIIVVNDGRYQVFDAMTGATRYDFQPSQPGPSPLLNPTTYVPLGDGKIVAASEADPQSGGVVVFEASTGKTLTTIQPRQNNGSHRMAFSADGKLLAIAGPRHERQSDAPDYREYVDLWELPAGKRVGEIHAGERQPVVAISLSPDGKRLALLTDSLKQQLWNVPERTRIADLPFTKGQGMTTLLFNPDSTMLGLWYGFGQTELYDANTGKELARGKGTLPFGGMGFVSPGKVLVVGTPEKRLTITDLFTPSAPAAEISHGRPAIVTQFSPDGRSLFSYDPQQMLIRWDLETGKAAEMILNNKDRKSSWDQRTARISEDTRWFLIFDAFDVNLFSLTGKDKGTSRKLVIDRKYVARWDRVDLARDGQSIFAYGRAQEKSELGLKDSVAYAIQWKLDGSTIKEQAGARRENEEEFFQKTFPGAAMTEKPGMPPANRTLRITRDNSSDSRVIVTDTASGKVLLDVLVPLESPSGISFGTEGQSVALPLRNNTIHVYDLK